MPYTWITGPFLVSAHRRDANEGTGIRSLIDERCRSIDSSCRTLSADMAVKALVGAMFRGSRRTPHHLMDTVFGSSVKPSSLSDTHWPDA